MARRAFYSFHYKPDCSRAALVRNIGAVEGNKLATDNEWETITSGGDKAIEKWIDDQLYGKSCAVVLIGAATAGRKWIDYEVKKAWTEGKGLVGVYIHGLKDLKGNQAIKGANPFSGFNVGGTNMSSIVKAYDPAYSDSKQVYNYIAEHLAEWFDEAVKIREKY
jgi:hypothetical protein